MADFRGFGGAAAHRKVHAGLTSKSEAHKGILPTRLQGVCVLGGPPPPLLPRGELQEAHNRLLLPIPTASLPWQVEM